MDFKKLFTRTQSKHDRLMAKIDSQIRSMNETATQMLNRIAYLEGDAFDLKIKADYAQYLFDLLEAGKYEKRMTLPEWAESQGHSADLFDTGAETVKPETVKPENTNYAKRGLCRARLLSGRPYTWQELVNLGIDAEIVDEEICALSHQKKIRNATPMHKYATWVCDEPEPHRRKK